MPDVSLTVATAAEMRALGRSLATVLHAGDLVILTGGLGAGKTTLTQGIGDGLGVRGPITSPTFVIARVHPSEVGGPALVHVDAYRLGSIAEVDDLDLDASLEDSVTVVEWGEGLVDDLTTDRLHVAILRPHGAAEPAATGGGSDDANDPGEDRDDRDDRDDLDDIEPELDEPRQVRISSAGSRWSGIELGA
jgi:tRNA threonylcarbamoyladenosine biosynthesis protein TsaE